jgi:hypothetical protein
MITKELAQSLKIGTVLYHKTIKNSGKTPYKCKITGKCKIWKTRHLDFSLPVKQGLRNSFYIYQGNAAEWSIRPDGDEFKEMIQTLKDKE